MTISYILIMMLFLQTKHLIVDWMWQPEYEFKNKGTYLHPGGLIHAIKNACGTALCFSFFLPLYYSGIDRVIILYFIMLVDFVIHYHIDYGKMNINQIKSWGPLTHKEFWWLTGFDQFLHQVTYLILIWWFAFCVIQ